MTTLFNSKQETNGFAGRPLVALLAAVGAGGLSSSVAQWMHIDSSELVLLCTLVFIAAIGYYWSLAENKRYKHHSERVLNERQ